MNILVAVDGSENALSAVRQVIAMKDWFREPLNVSLLTVQLPVVSGIVKMFINKEQLNDYYRDEGNRALARAREMLDQAGIAYQHHIGIGDPAQTIVDYAREKQCAQIVLGTRGMGNFAGTLLGSTASRVAQTATVPVLLVK